MISTGATIEAAARVLLEAGCALSLLVVAAHGLFIGTAIKRLALLPIQRVIVTDSVPLVDSTEIAIERVSLAPLLADAIRAIHGGSSLEPLRSRR